MITGAAAMIKCLEKEGVNTVFGYPGAAIAPFYDALSRSNIRHVLTRTEQGAGHAASGFARVTGKPGVCVATSGPGATNLFTAIATAYSDSIPLVAITGQVASHLLGRDVFQEVDTTGAAEPFTKYSYLVKDAQELPRVFKEAFYIASTGRRGPVLIDVPVDIQRQELKFRYPESVNIRGYKPKTEGHALQIKRVAEAIGKAKRPLLCCGGGVFLSGAQEAARRFCDEVNIPAVSTLMGVGALPKGHPLYCGMLGQSGAKTANWAVANADLLILAGARAGDRAISPADALGARATIVHIDIDTAEIGKNVGTTIPIVGDANSVLTEILKKQPSGGFSDWVSELTQRREDENIPAKHEGSGLDPAGLVAQICGRLDDDCVYVSDVGQNQIWSARGFSRFGRGRFLTTGGMGTMGYSIPAAIGAKLADPSKTVLAVCGDGAFQISMNELATMRQDRAPIKLVVVNNRRLGMIREIQQNAYHREFAVEIDGPDIEKIARAYGVEYALADSQESCPKAVAKLFSGDGAFILECRVDAGEVVG